MHRHLEACSRQTEKNHWFNTLCLCLLLLVPPGCSKRDNQLDEAKRLLEQESSIAARQYILEHKLDITPEGAQMLIAALMQNGEYARALARISDESPRFTQTTRTDVCTIATWDAIRHEELSLARSRLKVCKGIHDTKRVDMRAVKTALDELQEDDAKLSAQWREWVEEINHAEGSPETDMAADVLLETALRVTERQPEAKRGQEYANLIADIDALPLRVALIEWQLKQLPELPNAQAKTCIRQIEDSAGNLISEFKELSQKFNDIKSQFKWHGPNNNQLKNNQKGGEEPGESEKTPKNDKTGSQEVTKKDTETTSPDDESTSNGEESVSGSDECPLPMPKNSAK